MRHCATACAPGPAAWWIALLLLATGLVSAQTVPLEWRRAGNTLVSAGLADPASGGVARVWYSAGGGTLYARTATGNVFERSESDEDGGWRRSRAAAPVTVSLLAGELIPERGAKMLEAGSGVRYAWAASIFRSADEGRSWDNTSRYRGASLIGEGLADLAVSPSNPEEITAATASGVWRSADGGLSWSGMNDGLPNLPLRRLLSVRPLRAELFFQEASRSGEAVWQAAAGREGAWRPTAPDMLDAEALRRRGFEQMLREQAPGSAVTADASAGDWIYAASAGRIWVSADRGRSWRVSPVPGPANVTRLLTFAQEPRTALAVLATDTGSRVARTVNGGLFWDDVTSDLPASAVGGIAADFESGAVYAATAAGLYYAQMDLLRAAPAPSWRPIGDLLPASPAVDVMLDAGGSQLYVALEGDGVWAALAPHRFRDPRLVNAADRSTRAAAPGTLLSVLGALVSRARAGSLNVPVLAASGGESQIQVPFEVSGSQLDLQLTPADAGAPLSLSLPLRAASPAIFVDPDGAPMVLDADRGVLLDAGSPARAGSRIQILATGLGRVTPEWPTGLAAPADSPPRVAAAVRAMVDRVPVVVTKATLAPGYIGFYVVEVQLPDVVNNGPAELAIETGGQSSAAVTLHLVQ
ncbi:MAG: hypothetical protein R2762_03880 [Bryobacteraceae bacterium]